VSKEEEQNKLREFGFILAIATVLLFGFIIPYWGDGPINLRGVAVGFAFLLVALTLPILLRPIYIVWMKIGLVLGWVNTRIILSVVYFVFFMPLGLIMWLFGKDPMARCLNKSQCSYRKEVMKKTKSLEKPY